MLTTQPPRPCVLSFDSRLNEETSLLCTQVYSSTCLHESENKANVVPGLATTNDAFGDTITTLTSTSHDSCIYVLKTVLASTSHNQIHSPKPKATRVGVATSLTCTDIYSLILTNKLITESGMCGVRLVAADRLYL